MKGMEKIISINESNYISTKQLFNKDRLKAAREYREIGVGELAELLGVKRQTISMCESVRLPNPGVENIRKMSEVLKFPVDFFLERTEEHEMGPVFFRSLLTSNNRYKAAQEQRMEFIEHIYECIRSYLEFPKHNFPAYNPNLTPEEAAQKLREQWGLGNKPIKDLVYIVEDHGVVVTTFESSSDDVDAFSKRVKLRDGEECYFIGYSKNKTAAARIHFDIAHELGHIMLHRFYDDIEGMEKDEFKEMENEAHNFASAFLLPEDSFKKDIAGFADNLSYYIQLKKKWRVSIAAMIRRAYNLKLINMETYQELMRTMQRKGMRKIEPLDGELFTAEPTLLKTAMKMLLDEVLTPEEFMDELANEYQLTLDNTEVEKLLNLPPGTLAIDKKAKIHKLELKKR